MDHQFKGFVGDWGHHQTQTNILASSHDFRKYNNDEDTWGFIINLNSRQKGKLWIASHFEMPAINENEIILSENRRDFLGRPMADINFLKIFEDFDRNLNHCKTVLLEMQRLQAVKNFPLTLSSNGHVTRWVDVV